MNGGGTRFFGNIPVVLKNLLIINILVYALTWVIGGMMNWNLVGTLGLYHFRSEYFQPYQLVTHMFMHGGLAHIFMNMFMLWMFGRVLEQVWGGKRFLFYFFFTGLGAAALHMVVLHIEYVSLLNDITSFQNTPSPDLFISFIRENRRFVSDEGFRQLLAFADTWSINPGSSQLRDQAIGYSYQILENKLNIPTVGASGAVYGVLLAFGMLFPNMPLILIFFPFFPIKAKYMVIGMGVLELIYGVSWSGSNVAHFAHLGGMIFGFILIKYWNANRKSLY
jgi:membrane associated rhomboid family serine protease